MESLCAELKVWHVFVSENAATPYAATVSINDMQYGVGYGTSKKQAKSEAARATLEILIPEMKSKITTDAKTGSSASRDQDQDLSVICLLWLVFFGVMLTCFCLVL